MGMGLCLVAMAKKMAKMLCVMKLGTLGVDFLWLLSGSQSKRNGVGKARMRLLCSGSIEIPLSWQTLNQGWAQKGYIDIISIISGRLFNQRWVLTRCFGLCFRCYIDNIWETLNQRWALTGCIDVISIISAKIISEMGIDRLFRITLSMLYR